MKLTEKCILKITPGKERIQEPDDDLRGFGLRVESAAEGGRKSFYWRAKLKGQNVFRSLGEFPGMGLGNARNEAKRLAGLAAEWKARDYEPPNPFERTPRSEPTSVPTFKQLVEAYIANHIHSTDEDERANNPKRAEYQVRWMVGLLPIASGRKFEPAKAEEPRLRDLFESWLDRPLDTITDKDVLTLKNACGERRYLANRAVEFIRALYNWSGRKNGGGKRFWPVAQNPAADVKSYKENPRKEYLSPAELLRFNTAVDEEKHVDLRDFLILAMTTAARRGDILSMRWEDVKFEEEAWKVPFPKNGESYNVQLLPAALDVLKRRDTEKLADAVYVFPGPGKTGHLIELKKPWNAFRKRAGIPHIRIHSLRRTVGSYMAISGVSLLEIGAALGHRSMQSTLVYAELCDESTRTARETGQAGMRQMMLKARKRAKLTGARQHRSLTA